LNIPHEANLSPAANDILKRLLCDSDHRLGAGGVEEIKSHPFFEKINWESIRNAKSPFEPELVSDDDCKRFDKFEEEEPFYPPEDKKNPRKQRKDVNFPGYTFKKDVEEQRHNFVKAINDGF
jgi:serine/threonine kinase 38